MKEFYICLLISVFALPAAAQMTFVHPGGISNKADLEFVKAKLKDGKQPWTKAFEELKLLANASENSVAPTTISAQRLDSQKAYANALAWYFTGKREYAEQSISILNIWANNFPGYSPIVGQNQLEAAWVGTLLAPAAELMRNYRGWRKAERAKLKEMFKTKFYPALDKMSVWNGNVDLTQIDALINISVFNDDEATFNLAIARFKRRVPAYFYQASDGSAPNIGGDGGNINSFWHNPQKWVDGLTQETCRDNNHHTQFALASALHTAEVAWNQGIDLYTPNQKRFIDTMELMALQLTSKSMQGVCKNDTITETALDTWEIGYKHYHSRKLLKLPNTEKVLNDLVRPKGVNELNVFFETLTHGEFIKN
jgi:hypothetical protein